MSLAAMVQLELDAAAASPSPRVLRLELEERIHEPYRLQLTIARDGTAADLAALLGTPAAAEIALPAGGSRRIEGYVDGIDLSGGVLALAIAPRATWCARGADHRVFLGRDAVRIASEVLAGHGLRVSEALRRAPASRPQRVQAFESDLGFALRVLAEEGIAALFGTESADEVRLVDDPSGWAAIDGAERLPWAEESGLRAPEHVSHLRLEHAMRAGAVRLRDHDFERPAADLEVAAARGAGTRRRFEPAAGYRDPAVGRLLAERRLEEASVGALILRARSTSARLAAGRSFRLEGAPRDELDRVWLVVACRLRILDHGAGVDAEPRVEAAFEAIPADTPYRPARVVAPVLGGVQTATVTGPPGAEIHTEANGRAKALLRWDRRGRADDSSSHWLRTGQPQTSGAVLLPRVGWEVLLGFEGPSGDAPCVLGRLDNGAAPPAEGLPAKQVRSALGSRTTPGGGSANVMMTDDSAGNEGFLLGASSNYKERTEADKAVSIKADHTHTVGADHTRIVAKVCQVKVGGAQTYDVGGSRSVDVAQTMTVDSASESVSVGAVRNFTVGGDSSTETRGSLSRLVGGPMMETAIESHNMHVTGAATVLAGGAWNEIGGTTASLGVGGAHLRTVAGAMAVRAPVSAISASALAQTFASLDVDGGVAVSLSAAGTLKVGVAGAASFSGAAVKVEGKSKVVLEGGGMRIELTPGAIDVKGAVTSSVGAVVSGTDERT
ncbi:MAG: type VI secretion system tip protein TssI/VgrG [Polyangiaceae bacterium]